MANMRSKKLRKFIGILLHVERRCRKISQEDIAHKLHVTQEQICKFESGKRGIDVAELITYCESLKLTPVEFAAKIETRLFSEGLLPRPNRLIPKEPCTIEKIRVDVLWRENIYSASFGENVPGTVEIEADTFLELQDVVIARLGSHVERMVKDGVEVPQWLRNKTYEFQYRFLDARSLLQAYGQYLSLATISRVSVVNQSLLSLYANGKKNASPHQLERIVYAINKIGKELMAVVP